MATFTIRPLVSTSVNESMHTSLGELRPYRYTMNKDRLIRVRATSHHHVKYKTNTKILQVSICWIVYMYRILSC